ncbi:XRE family transcriptional regulator [Paucilactobacillus hokkaidonensis JCM 18461]|uniref:3'-5' exonuclease DinG n=2 Tax=Paucilactobacillus hokkaidonensis TaxID=1193095 RepID=A0A0A1GXI4_9LACO|nr:helicase C-terminal domain-containing protein [Paucilactobacillus hokkaidonensis]BAP85609.1 XRE family transcriptional regulator [Paucilactobacillus hokkaidonensis JCM 18461]
MQTSPIYAVVDLETTGTNLKNGDRIIQIGCVLVSDGEVINHFQTNINPRMPIPTPIEQLTGITNAAVRNAPLFDDVAATIYSLLSDTIFVAHNVNFDFPFLNAELEKAGFPTLEITAIDTVTLSQILLPTAQSFRLRDLTSYLAIAHDSPHSADSDASATGKLLIKLLNKLHQTPTMTLKAITNLGLELPYETMQVFKHEIDRRSKDESVLAEDLYIKDGIVLKKELPSPTINLTKVPKYPSSKTAKQKIFGDHLRYRGSQAKMMNMIYNNYSHPEPQNLIIEAGTGVGKTLGYLVPMLYLTYPNQKVVVSTATNVLQQQMASQAMTQLNQILPFEVGCVVLKGNEHYLDLAKFVHSLSVVEEANQVQMIKARLLIWLLQTNTGDLDELQLTSYRAAYFNEITHQGVGSLNTQNDFYDDDFLIRRQHQLKHANVIITNHAYLGQHAQELGEQLDQPYLIIDEAQHLSENILRQSRRTLNFQSIMTVIHLLEGLVNDGNSRNLSEVFAQLPMAIYNVKLLRTDLSDLENAIKQFEQALYRQFMLNISSADSAQIIEQPIDNQTLLRMLQPSNDILASIKQALGSIHLHFNALHHLFESQSNRWLISDRYLVTQFQSQLVHLTQTDETLNQFMDILNNQADAAVFWLTVQQSLEQSTMRLSGGLLTTNKFLVKQIYPYFKRPTFVGATLFSSSRSQFLYHQLDLDQRQTKTKKLVSPFNYADQSRLFIANDAPIISAQNYQDYIRYLSDTIYQITKNNPRQTMVLFNSLLTIEQIYSQLRSTDLFTKRDILAQGITGTKEKLLKQFTAGHQSILLGAASFWEGIDLPKNQLELLIITRLPFDSPAEVLTKAENNWLQKNHKNPFYNSALPKATLKIRQGLGRLIRTEEDRGVAIILDKRIIERKYGQTMLKTLPEALPIESLPTEEIIDETKNFFKK